MLDCFTASTVVFRCRRQRANQTRAACAARCGTASAEHARARARTRGAGPSRQNAWLTARGQVRSPKTLKLTFIDSHDVV